MGKYHIIATIGSNIIMSGANNITFAQAKTSFFYRPKVKRQYNTLHLAGKEVCKKDEENLVLFELNIKLLYGRYTKQCFLLSAHDAVKTIYDIFLGIYAKNRLDQWAI